MEPINKTLLDYGLAGAFILLLVMAIAALWKHAVSSKDSAAKMEQLVKDSTRVVEENTTSNKLLAHERLTTNGALQNLALEIKHNTEVLQQTNVSMLAALTKALEK